ncbi:MAG: hypothetical protein PF542_01740 [Nanoarchaeota archaeon]|jgi:hypothetical protein|nr:hypothetical protein [Nanoarchaeota archaeon]
MEKDYSIKDIEIEKRFNQKIVNYAFEGIKEYQDYLCNSGARHGNYQNDIEFNFGIKNAKGRMYSPLSADKIRKSRRSEDVMGYTKIPSITLFENRLKGLELFLLAPGEETGFLRRGSNEKIFDNHTVPNNPVWRANALEILFPLGSFKANEDFSFICGNTLHQYTQDKQPLFTEHSVIQTGNKLGAPWETSRAGRESQKNRHSPSRPQITRGFMPSGQRFGEKSTIVNDHSSDHYQLFGLMGVDTANPFNRDLMAMIAERGVIPLTNNNYKMLDDSVIKSLKG